MEIRLVKANDRLAQKQVNTICEWSDAAFGKNYLSPQHLSELLSRGKLILVSAQDELLGASLLIELEASSVHESLHQFVDSNKKPALYRKFVLVNPKFRQQGIAKLIMNEIDNVSEAYPLIYTSIWQKPGIDSYSEQLINRGYIKGELIRDFWKEDSLQRQFACVSCQKIPCECSARIYYKLNS